MIKLSNLNWVILFPEINSFPFACDGHTSSLCILYHAAEN